MPPAKKEKPKSEKKAQAKQKISSDSKDLNAGVSFEVYMSGARTFQSTGQYKKAINNYTKALEMKPNEKRCHIGRAECYYDLGVADKSLADANEVLKHDKNYIKGLLMKAESFYHMTQFENALVYFHRGNNLRPEIRQFRLGIQKCEEAIENSIGESANVSLEATGDLSYFYEEQECLKSKRTVVYFKTPSDNDRDGSKGSDSSQTAGQNNKTCKQLLGELFKDKEYLENLLRENSSVKKHSDTSKSVKSLAEGELDYLNHRTEFWHKQKPNYTKRQKYKIDKTGTNPQKRNLTDWLMKKLEDIDRVQSDGDHEKCLTEALNVLNDVQKWTSRDQEQNQELIANLHSFIGTAYMETKDNNRALSHLTKDYDISIKRDSEEGKSRALDNLGKIYARMENYEKAVEIWEEKLPLCSSALEKTWLYHELGRSHFELGHYDKANEYGEKSKQESIEADDNLWKLNATVLVAQTQVKRGNRSEALQLFEEALILAQTQDDVDAQVAIESAINEIENSNNSEAE